MENTQKKQLTRLHGNQAMLPARARVCVNDLGRVTTFLRCARCFRGTLVPVLQPCRTQLCPLGGAVVQQDKDSCGLQLIQHLSSRKERTRKNQRPG